MSHESDANTPGGTSRRSRFAAVVAALDINVVAIARSQTPTLVPSEEEVEAIMMRMAEFMAKAQR